MISVVSAVLDALVRILRLVAQLVALKPIPLESSPLLCWVAQGGCLGRTVYCKGRSPRLLIYGATLALVRPGPFGPCGQA